jgi:hypothetical protein
MAAGMITPDPLHVIGQKIDSFHRPCKNRKIKCGEEHPGCLKYGQYKTTSRDLPSLTDSSTRTSCQKAGETCDYRIRLNWDGRRGKPSEQGTILDFSSEVRSPTIPVNGFKLVHQFPASANTAGSKIVEPLVSHPSTKKRVMGLDDTTIWESTMDTKSAHKRQKSKSIRGQHVETDSKLRHSESSSSTETIAPANAAYSRQDRHAEPQSISSSDNSDSRDKSSSERPDDLAVTSPDAGRVSVNSLLLGPAAVQGIPVEYSGPQFAQHPTLEGQLSRSVDGVYYGIDRGLPDLDLGKNDDENAISAGTSPLIPQDQIDMLLNEFDEDLFSTEFAFGLETMGGVEQTGGYYESHVSWRGPLRKLGHASANDLESRS